MACPILVQIRVSEGTVSLHSPCLSFANTCCFSCLYSLPSTPLPPCSSLYPSCLLLMDLSGMSIFIRLAPWCPVGRVLPTFICCSCSTSEAFTPHCFLHPTSATTSLLLLNSFCGTSGPSPLALCSGCVLQRHSVLQKSTHCSPHLAPGVTQS